MKAFPQKYPLDPLKPYVSESNPLDGGMDLRDYFAAKAMQGFLSESGEVVFDGLAKDSYRVADAMMEARK